VSSKLIEPDKFIEFFQVDPYYFERTFLLIPNNSEKPYALLRKLLEKTGLAAVTMSTWERVVLIHYYQNASWLRPCAPARPSHLFKVFLVVLAPPLQGNREALYTFKLTLCSYGSLRTPKK